MEHLLDQLSQEQALLLKKNAEVEEQLQLVRRALYGAQINLADLAWRDNRIADMRRILEPYRPVSGDDANAKLRGFEWHSLCRLCDGDLPVLQEHTGPIFSVAFSPDGKLLASAVRTPQSSFGTRPPGGKCARSS